MKHTDFDFNGQPLALSFTADALFKTYDKFGICDNILDASHAFEPTNAGWINCCWLAALMAEQGELQRRYRGEDPRPMVTLEDLRTGFMAGESVRLYRAVRAALEQGFATAVEDENAPEEINEILATREEREKKARPPFAAAILQPLLDCLGFHRAER